MESGMRIGIAGFHIESCTFTHQTTGMADFEIMRGEEVVAAYPLGRWFGSRVAEVEFVGLITANAGANGPIQPRAYDDLENELAERLSAAGDLDGLYLDMHGAASVVGRTKAEERWLRRIRASVGTIPISGSFDTHGNLSHELAELMDLVAFHRHAPHIDNEQTRERAVRLLVDIVERKARPYKAWVRIPALLPGERTSTAVEPGRTVFGQLTEVINTYGLVDAAMCVGFYWADEARNHAAVLTTAWDVGAAVAGARELASRFWLERAAFELVADNFGPWREALDFVLSHTSTSTLISDAGDNVTAGSSGELTYALAETLARHDVTESGARFLFAGIVDPATTEAAIEAGAGATLARAVGTGNCSLADPVGGPWRVVQLLTEPSSGVTTGALLTNGVVDVTVQKSRAPFVSPDDPSFPPGMLRGLAPAKTSDYDAVVVKNGYMFPSQANVAGEFFMAITPGGTDLEPERLDYSAIERPLYPWDNKIEASLTPEIVATWSGRGIY